MWNIRAVVMLCSGEGWVSASEALLAGAGRSAGTHGGAVTAAAFSPDGTALATVAADGYVMFAQVVHQFVCVCVCVRACACMCVCFWKIWSPGVDLCLNPGSTILRQVRRTVQSRDAK